MTTTLVILSTLVLFVCCLGLAVTRLMERAAEREFDAMRAPAQLGTCKSRLCGCSGYALPVPGADVSEALSASLRARSDALTGGQP
jgi:hypothetical protein